MTHIKISVPNDDHVALRAMAKALEEIAVARGAPSKSKQIGELNYKINIDTTQATAALGELSRQVESDTTPDQLDSLVDRVEDLLEVAEQPFQGEVMPTTDSTGTPWDERIHSASKALNADGTWRLRRKPKDMDEGEWADYVEQVSNELKWDSRQLGASEEHVKVVEEETLAQIQELIKERAAATNDLKELLARNEPSVTPEGDDFHVDTGVVTEQQVATFPPPPPVPASLCQCKSELPGYHTRMCPQFKESAMTVKLPESEPVTMTFPQVMAFLTERHGRITSAQVDQIIADMGLEKITDLNTQPEHTGPFIARVKALLGE